MGIFDWKHWAVILVVVVLVFGTKKLKNLGGDLAETIKGFRRAMHEDDKAAEHAAESAEQPAPPLERPSAQASATPLGADALKKG